ncbi:MAG: ABC transporter permease [Deltaproteobacteria bacterium]|nr:MAG: ABC transporter permease [Deltaproteobacteria bacterium]
MDLSDNLRIGIRSLRAHKLRTLLTTLGVVFGVAAVVSMLAIAGGARREAVEQIRLLGTNNIRVHRIDLSGDAAELAERKGSPGLEYTDGALIRAALPGLSGVAPVRFVDEAVLRGSRETTGRIVATSSDYARITDFRAARGRFISPLDVRDLKRVAVIGADVKEELFGYLDPIGHRVRIGDGWFTVVGVMERKSLRKGRASVIQVRDLNKDVYVPITTAAGRFSNDKGRDAVSELAIKVSSGAEVVPTAAVVRRIIERAHNGVEDFEILVPAELLARAQRTQRVFNIVMGSIAAISLLVGGIGIMNIMLASVTERTREIGTRRALGATRRAILGQFLIETVLTSASGGVLGILLGLAMAKGISVFAGWQTVVSASGTLIAFAISALVGVVFGLYPAERAARMDPIAALRFE